jgi:hypothetical protein
MDVEGEGSQLEMTLTPRIVAAVRGVGKQFLAIVLRAM